jgi:hypothetical protein
MSSKNHYTKREQQLESVLATKQTQVAVLEQKRSTLVNKVCSATAAAAAAAAAAIPNQTYVICGWQPPYACLLHRPPQSHEHLLPVPAVDAPQHTYSACPAGQGLAGRHIM